MSVAISENDLGVISGNDCVIFFCDWDIKFKPEDLLLGSKKIEISGLRKISLPQTVADDFFLCDNH